MIKEIAIGLASIFLLALTLVSAQQEQTTISNVTVNKYVAIGLSTNLTEGILFGTLDPGTNDNNATHNYDGSGGGTTYWVTISSDSNVNVDVCIKDNAPLTKLGGTDTIPNSGYTWNCSTSATEPALPGTAISTTYTKTDCTNVAPGNNVYFRFWLDIPTAQAPGDYNNTVYFKGVEAGQSC